MRAHCPLLVALTLAAILVWNPGLHAQAVPPGSAPDAPVVVVAPAAPVTLVPVQWGHRNQLSLRVGLSEGWRFTIRYGDGSGPDPCDLTNSKFCSDLAPLMLDTALGFGVSQGVELDLRFRVGVVPDFDGSTPLQVGAGVRSMSDPLARFKFFLAGAALMDLTTGRLRQGTQYDLVVRGEVGAIFDVWRWLGIYFNAGGSFAILRNFSAILDGTLGLQFRAP